MKVYPFSDPAIFDREITRPWLHGNQQGVLRLKTLVNYVTLRRTQSVIDLPKRIDLIRYLDFSSAEQEVYDAAKIRTREILDDAISSGTTQRGHYLNALQWLKTLRRICNHGVLESRRGQTRSPKENSMKSEEWNETAAQAAFEDMECAGATLCSHCTTNISENVYETLFQELSGRPRLLACLQLLCNTCFNEKSENTDCPACSSIPRCSSFEVSISGGANALSQGVTPGAQSQMSTPGGSGSDANTPIKLKALANDLDSTRNAKRYS